MLMKVSLLSKRLVATYQGASVGPFACVDPKMVKEIVPLPENQVAVLVVTF
jgi:hypothetical protein